MRIARKVTASIPRCYNQYIFKEHSVLDDHSPTMAKAAVKIWSNTRFASELKDDMQPPKTAARAALVQVESVTNGGDVLFS